MRSASSPRLGTGRRRRGPGARAPSPKGPGGSAGGGGPRLVLPVQKTGAGFSFGHLAVFDCPRAPLEFDGRAYHGTLALHSQGGGVSVVNGLPLDTYLRGVVPSESPSHWPLAALEAQAVAARSYAASELRPSSWDDLVPTPADQGYGGGRGPGPPPPPP